MTRACALRQTVRLAYASRMEHLTTRVRPMSTLQRRAQPVRCRRELCPTISPARTPAVRVALITSHDSVRRAARQRVDSEDGHPAPIYVDLAITNDARDIRRPRSSMPLPSARTAEARPPGALRLRLGINLDARSDPRPTPLLVPSARPLPTRYTSASSGGSLESPSQSPGPGQTPRPANLNRSEPPRPSASARRHEPTTQRDQDRPAPWGRPASQGPGGSTPRRWHASSSARAPSRRRHTSTLSRQTPTPAWASAWHNVQS
jgi:hypothetical protein